MSNSFKNQFCNSSVNLSHCLFPCVILNSTHPLEYHTVTKGHEHEGTRERDDAEEEEVVPEVVSI